MDGEGLEWGERNENEPVWVRDEAVAWRAGVLEKVRAADADVRSCDGELVSVKLRRGAGKGGMLLPRDVSRERRGVDNMDDLTHLHEASILHNVAGRFAEKCIYTRTGPILVAMNPFEWLPIYGEDVMRRYRGSSRPDELEPHCFAEAEWAHRELVEQGRSQSLIICGESGAGKTETTKLMLQYLSHNYTGDQDRGIADRIMKSNPVMEAFGNAKTLRNNNSSRFGKFLTLDFAGGNVRSAHVTNYLLEKSRTVRQNEGERNYHIFYQLCKGADAPLRERLRLAALGVRDFGYLNQSSCSEVDGVDDARDFAETRAAMEAMGITTEEIEAVLRVVAAILHLGNAAPGKSKAEPGAQARELDQQQQQQEEEEESKGPDESPRASADALDTACALLECDSGALRKALKVRYVVVNGKAIESPLAAREARDLRDALAKATYERLFSHLVERINKSLQVVPSEFKTFIGILDIYGFESFRENGFEQLLINYANEKLQSLFNDQVFCSEEETYRLEGVPFSRTDIPDNAPCLVMMDGIFKLMHDECLRMSAGSDKGLASQITQRHRSSSHFEACGPGSPKRGTSDLDFCVRHYAGDIVYHCASFVEKNRDTLYPHVQTVLAASDCDLVKLLFPRVENGGEDGGSSRLIQTVAKRFSAQVHALTETIKATGPRFVRCIKSNNELVPAKVDHNSVLRQLKNAGVVAALEMRRAGFPNRLPYRDFVLRCRALLPPRSDLAHVSEGGWRALAESLLQNPAIAGVHERAALGTTKVFLRANVLHEIDSVIQTLVRELVVHIQATMRMSRCWLRFVRIKRCAVFAQSHFRGRRVRREHAALLADLEVKRAWAVHDLQLQHLAARFDEPTAVFTQMRTLCGDSEERASELGLPLLEAYLDSARQSLAAAREVVGARQALEAAEAALTRVDQAASKVTEASTRVIETQRRIAERAQALQAEFAKQKVDFEQIRERELQHRAFFFNEDLPERARRRSQLFDESLEAPDPDAAIGEEDTAVVVDRFFPGYLQARSEVLELLSRTEAALHAAALAEGQTGLEATQQALARLNAGLESAVANKVEADANMERLTHECERVQSQYVGMLQRQFHGADDLHSLEDVRTARARASESVREVLLVLHGDKAAVEARMGQLRRRAENEYSDDEETDPEPAPADRGSRGFLDIAEAERALERATQAILAVDELCGRATAAVHARKESLALLKRARDEARGMLEEAELELRGELCETEQSVLFQTAAVRRSWDKSEKWLGRASKASRKQLTRLDGEATALTEEIAACARETLESAETAVAEAFRARGKLEKIRAAQETARARLLPGLDLLRETRARLAKFGLSRRFDVLDTIRCAEREVAAVEKQLVLEEGAPLPGSALLERLPREVESALAVIRAANEYVQEEIDAGQRARDEVADCRQRLAAVTAQLGALKARLSQHHVFASRSLKSLTMASSCGAKVCDLAGKLSKSLKGVDLSLSRASGKLARLYASSSDASLVAQEDPEESRKLLCDLKRATLSAETRCGESQVLLGELVHERGRELEVLDKHRSTLGAMDERLQRAVALRETVCRHARHSQSQQLVERATHLLTCESVSRSRRGATRWRATRPGPG